VAFRGIVVDTSIEWLALGDGYVITVDASDYSCLAERRLIRASTTGGISGRTAIDYVVDTYLAGYGVTRDAGMPAGATLGALSYDYEKATKVLDDIVRIAAPTGWLWRINENKVLTAWAPSIATHPCPFTMETSDPNTVGDISIKELREEYANRVILTYGDGTDTPAGVISEDTVAQASRGIFEAKFSIPGTIDAATAQQIANGHLVRLVNTPTQIRFNTITPGARAGQTIGVDLPARNISGDYMITEMEIRDVDGKNVFYTITAIEGNAVRYSWKDTYINWADKGNYRGWSELPAGGSAVAYDAVSESHTGSTASTSEGSFSWTHTPVGTPRGVTIFAFCLDDATDLVSSITYGGVDVPAVAGGTTSWNSGGTPNRTKAFHLGTGIPTGAQTVLVTRTNNASQVYVVVATQTGTTDTEVFLPGIVLLSSNTAGAMSEQSVTDGSAGVNSIRFAGFVCGDAGVGGASGPSSTGVANIATGSPFESAGVVRETTAGQGARNVGFGATVFTGHSAVHLAVRGTSW
jgi:hypothetical protein